MLLSVLCDFYNTLFTYSQSVKLFVMHKGNPRPILALLLLVDLPTKRNLQSSYHCHHSNIFCNGFNLITLYENLSIPLLHPTFLLCWRNYFYETVNHLLKVILFSSTAAVLNQSIIQLIISKKVLYSA